MTNGPPSKDPGLELAAEVRPLVERLYADLNTLSYYQFLGVGEAASVQAIQQAFYRRAVRLHPDRHFKLKDKELKNKIREVYKRIAEGYRILSSQSLRRAYDAGLRRGEIRIQQRAFDRTPAENPGEPSSLPPALSQIHDESARQLYQKASAKMRDHDFGQAIGLLEQALNLEPDSNVISRRLEDARRLLRLWDSGGL